MSERRSGYIDIAKGLCMLAVVWGHIHLEGTFTTWVYGFDIPAFLFLAGMVYNTKKYDSLPKLVKARWKSLLVPYFIYSFITWIPWAAARIVEKTDKDIFSPLLQTFIAQGSVHYLPHNVPLWFVTCLFLVIIMYYGLSKLPDIVSLAASAVLAALGYLSLQIDLPFQMGKLPWNAHAALMAMPYFTLGNLMVKHFGFRSIYDEVHSKRVRYTVILFVITVLFTFLTLYNGPVSLGSVHFGKSVLLYYLVGFIGIAMTLVLSMLIDRAFPAPIEKIKSGIQWIGRNSMIFLLVHSPIRSICTKLIGSGNEEVSDSVPLSLAVLVITVIGCAFFEVMLDKAKKCIKKLRA